MRLQAIALFCIRNSYQLQHFHSFFSGLIPGYFLIFDDSLCDLFANRNRWIQRQHRVLEHHAYLTSAQLFHFFSLISCDILSAETDLSAFYMCIRCRSFITLRHITVFPHPDSPTIQSISPFFTVRSTFRTACTSPSGVSKLTE